MDKPAIITRAEWGAVRARGCYRYRAWTAEDLARIYTRLTFHHDASLTSPCQTLEASMEQMRAHQVQHRFVDRWCDLGYHYVLGPAGQGQDWAILAGRSMFYRGAHTEKTNTGNLGVCLMGNFETQTPPQEAIASAMKLSLWLCWRYDIPSTRIGGHRDYVATACPGRHLLPFLATIRKGVQHKLEGGRQ